MKKKSRKFYAQQTAQSRIKAEIITKYFASRAKIISGAGATKMVYVDLWAGRGRYGDGSESTPLMVLRRAIDDPVVSKSLVTIFNDKEHADVLRAEIRALPGVETLRYEPSVYDTEVGAATPEVFERIKLAPTLAFLDPWGYKGLSRELIHSLLKDWACEVMFFFNYNRVNIDITNGTVTKHMEALFGAVRLAALRAAVVGLPGDARERAVMTALVEMVQEVGGRFVLPFRFVKYGAERTSHHLVFVSKNFLGDKIMRDVMAAKAWLWETGPDHAFTQVSEEITTLGIDPAALIGARRWDIATDVEGEPEKWRLHVAALEAHEPFRGFVYRTASADGSGVYISTSGRPLFDAEGRFLGYRGVTIDVTAAVHADQVEKALHQAQAELARVARVTTLGELAASIAHEINQPLAAIGAHASACMHWLAADKPDLDSVREALTAIVKDGDRAGAVISRIRALLARSSVAHEPCDLSGAVREVLPLVGPEMRRHDVLLETSLAPDLPQVMGDRIQLQQVLLNLLLNAAEAMREVPPARRRMVVRATLDQHDDGPWVVVAVEDAGVGFGQDEAARLFEAFYTTKPGGLGMGLSISRSIIDSHKGRLWATANPNHGATFHFALPAERRCVDDLRRRSYATGVGFVPDGTLSRHSACLTPRDHR